MMSATSRVLQLVSISAVIWAALRCIYQIQTSNDSQYGLREIQNHYNNSNAFSTSIIDALIRENINVPNGINYEHIMLDLMSKNKVKQKHASNMIYLNEADHAIWKKPVLLIIEPADLLLDSQLITITDQLNVTAFTKVIREYNKDTLRFAFGSDGSDRNQIYAIRPKLIYLISWLHRLSTQFGITFEIVVYSNVLGDIELIYFLNLIEIYYNAVIRETEDIDHWFRFIGSIVAESDPKTLQDIESILPFGDYEAVLLMDSDKSRWHVDTKHFKNVIGIETKSYKIGILEGTLNNVTSIGFSDNYLNVLIDVFKNFVTSKQYRDDLGTKDSKVMHSSTFWNAVTFNGNLERVD